MYSKQNQKKLEKIIKKYGCYNKSPYSESYYNSEDISWGYKPEGSLRISDHWNFCSNGETHCAIESGEYLKGWFVGKYKNGIYTELTPIFTEEEIKLEEKMEKAYFARLEKERVKKEKENKKINALIAKGHEFKISYRTSEKKGRRFITEVHEEICTVKGCWAYTSKGKKRVFEILEVA